MLFWLAVVTRLRVYYSVLFRRIHSKPDNPNFYQLRYTMDPQIPDSQALPAGTRLEEFMVERVLGSGGFGITYLAKDTSLGRQVVIKENLPSQFVWRETTTGTVRPRHSTGGDADDFEWSMRNFLREAETLASMDHPGIVRVLRKFEANGTAYFVMPFVEGISFDALIESRRRKDEMFSEDELGGLLSRMLESLGYLHDRGIYHRDIKPGNILVTMDGVPVLIDFGSARQRLSDHSMTVVESAGYTPFEQLQSKGNIGPWSDLYALGATILKALTFEALPKAMDRMRVDPHVPLATRSELASVFSQGFLKAIDKATAVDEGDRWHSAAQWQNAISKGWIGDPADLAAPAPNGDAGGISPAAVSATGPKPNEGSSGAVLPSSPAPHMLRTGAPGSHPVVKQAAAKPTASKSRKILLGIAALGLVGVAAVALNSRGRVIEPGKASGGQRLSRNASIDAERIREEAAKAEAAQQAQQAQQTQQEEARRRQEVAMAQKKETERVRAEADRAEQARLDAETKRHQEEEGVRQREAERLRNEAEAKELAKAKARESSPESTLPGPGAGGGVPPFLTKDATFPRSPIIDQFSLANPNNHAAALAKANELVTSSQKLAKTGREQQQTRDSVSGLTGRYSSAEHIRQQGKANVDTANDLMRQAQEIRTGVTTVRDYLKTLAKEPAREMMHDLTSKDGRTIKARIIGQTEDGFIIQKIDEEFVALNSSQLSKDSASYMNRVISETAKAAP